MKITVTNDFPACAAIRRRVFIEEQNVPEELELDELDATAVHLLAVQDGRPVAHVAKELGVSRQCAHRWVARYRAEGEAGLADRSSRPHRSPRRTSPDLEQQVLAYRAEHRCGQDEICAQLGLAPRTVNRVLQRHGVPLLAVPEEVSFGAGGTEAGRSAPRRWPPRSPHNRPGAWNSHGSGWRRGGRGSPGRSSTAWPSPRARTSRSTG